MEQETKASKAIKIGIEPAAPVVGGASLGVIVPNSNNSAGANAGRRPMNAFLLFCKRHRYQYFPLF